MIKKVMHAWEQRLSQADTNRTTLPFDWGLDFLINSPAADPKQSLFLYNKSSISNSTEFFKPSPLEKYHVDGDRLIFPGSIQSPYEVNNTTSCRIFRSEKPGDKAVVVLPQWNADVQSHVGLCKFFTKFGITALRLTLPYHEERNPSGPRADYMVSPNLGRTIQAIRQAVHDARRAADWLVLQNYTRLGIMGTSVGSCIGFLAFVHDERFQAGVFHHVSSYFGDVVWKGISTRHVRKGIEGFLTREELRKAWAVISPNSYVSRLRGEAPRKCLLLSARYDLTFPPDLANLLLWEHDRWNIPYDIAFLPWGHYSSARTPFKHMVGYKTVNYFRKHLKPLMKPATDWHG
jgi:hypothetical protein